MRAARLILAGLLSIAVLAIAAAWIAPPLLDWNGYRGTIAEVASRMLGQKVTIAGPVGLELLPIPALTADQVTVGDGVLAVGALRLHAALGPLLAGRIEPRDLVLQSPRLRLPWPPPPGLTAPTAWPAGLAVRIEDGEALFGSFAATGLQAGATVGETGALAIAGHGLIAGQDWSFAARLTAFGRDGSSGVDLQLDGGGKLAGTSARFTGQIAGLTSLSGTVAVTGNDLSALIPAPSLGFRAQGRVTAADGLVAADDLAIELAGAPARAAVALRLLPIQRLDLSLAIGRLDLAAWLLPLLHPPAGGAWGLPVGLDLSAEAADLAGATLRRLRCAFDLSPRTAELREASAILPGEATVSLTGQITRGDAAAFAGEASITIPDLPATSGWAVRAFGLEAAIAARLPRAAVLSGKLKATADQVALDKVSGTLEGAAADGRLRLHPGPHPALELSARLARLDLDAWLPAGLPRWSALNALAGDTAVSLDVRASAAALRGLTLRDLVLQADAVRGAVALHRLDARLAGARLQASGAIDRAGALADGRLDLAADAAGGNGASPLDAAIAGWIGSDAIGTLLRRVGALHLTMTAQGPTDAIAAHAELDAAGGRLLADPVIDVTNGSLVAAVSLTHPSAAGLLALLDWLPAGAEAWLGAGQLAVQADISATSERLAADRLAVRAGALQARAAVTADWQGPLPRLTGRIEAVTLPLPWPSDLAAGDGPLPFGLLNGWEATLEVSADRVLVGLVPVVSEAHLRLGVAEGVLGVGALTAKLDGGDVTASAAVDGTATPPTLQADATLRGAVIEGGLTGAAVDLRSGTASGQVRLAAAGYSLPALRATVHGNATLDVADGTLTGVDLGRLRAALLQAAGTGDSTSALTAALLPALSGGQSGFDTLHAEAELSSGGLSLRAARLAGPEGQMTAAGVVGPGGEGMDVRLGLRPAIEGGPEVGLRLTGPAAAPTHTPELSGVLRWLSPS